MTDTLTQSVQSLYKEAKDQFEKAGIDTADLDARILMREVFGITDVDFILNSPIQLSEVLNETFAQYVARRIKGEPVSRILGVREFWSLPFKVTTDTLDPRPDTEIMVEAALKAFSDGKQPSRLLDLGTGTGCILISLLHEWPHAQGVGVDISEGALRVAAENAALNKVDDRVDFICADWGEGITDKFDVILSNPPYIPSDDIANLENDVKNHDPIHALDGGEDGLDCYKVIVMKIKSLLNTDGRAFLEIGYQQASDLTRIVEEYGLCVETIHPDLGGIPRIVEISFGEKQKKACRLA